MVIDFIQVQNYRSIKDQILKFGELTALVGRNGSGKSSFLHVLELFYAPNAKVELDDFYNGDVSEEISVSVTFKDLTPEASTLFAKYIQNNSVTVQRIFKFTEGKSINSYHGSALQNPEFEEVRISLAEKGGATNAKSLYKGLKKEAKYSDLTDQTTKDGITDALRNWEAAHVDQCVRSKDDGQFFGFKTVAQGYLGQFTRFLFIPAVRDAADDATDSTNSPIAELMDLVVRSILASKPELTKLREDTQREFAALMADPAMQTGLDGLAKDMTTTLKKFVPEAGIEMTWQKIAEVVFPPPKADTKLNQDGYSSSVNRAGHGLQRAFIITALQHLALAQQGAGSSASESGSLRLPVLVLAIEEPELFQHPNSQHHLAKILLAIASGKTPGVAEKTQVVYCTHSPYFVGLDRINQIRLLRKKDGGADKPRVTSVVETDIDKIANLVWAANGSSGPAYTGATLLPRLHSIMTATMNEGFFADVAVLVEGEDDIAAIKGTSHALGHDLQSMGISIISCTGKNSIDRPALIFSELGIPVYIVWDGDKPDVDSKKINRTMLRLVGEAEVDFPSTQVAPKFACFEENLEKTMEAEIGSANYGAYLTAAQSKYGYNKKSEAQKNPAVVEDIIKAAKANGQISSSLEGIVNAIISLRHLSP